MQRKRLVTDPRDGGMREGGGREEERLGGVNRQKREGGHWNTSTD